MIRLDTIHYRIEEYSLLFPKRFSLDFKEQDPTGRVCAVNIGWFDCYEHALSAMSKDCLARFDRGEWRTPADLLRTRKQ